jgi:uncharacterized membrane protein
VRARRVGLQEVITESDLFTPEELDRDAFQREFLDRFGLRWFSSFGAIHFDQISPVVLTLERPTKFERFSRSEVEQISAIVPHIQRASRLSLAVVAAAAAGIMAALDHVNRAAILLDDLGLVVRMNGAAEHLMGHGVTRRCRPPPRACPELESSSQRPVMGGFPLAGIYEPVGRRDAKVRAGCVRTNPMTTETTSPVPHHVEEAVATIAALHAAHHREARALQKAVSRATSGIAQPATLILTTVAIASWVALNLALPEFGRAALDPFPFPLLAAVVSTIALYLAAMILMTQRHDDEMATRREQITLELAILSEQKSAKIIALLEEFRRNDPNQGNQRDEVAEALAEPADAQVVLDAIRAAEKAEDGG